MDPIDFQSQGHNGLDIKNLVNRIEDKAIIREAIARGCYACVALFVLL